MYTYANIDPMRGSQRSRNYSRELRNLNILTRTYHGDLKKVSTRALIRISLQFFTPIHIQNIHLVVLAHNGKGGGRSGVCGKRK